jgi:anti-sigma factor RsiW
MSNVSALSCTEVRELAPELALGILSGAERAEVLLHVNGCSRCQAHVAELTEAADVIPQLAPEAEPPAGFESRVLRRLDESDRRTRRRWISVVATAAAAAIIVSITVVRVIESGDSSSTQASAPVTTLSPKPVAVPMELTAAPLPAGWAYVNDGHGVAVSVSYGMPSGAYAVQVTSPRGHARNIGTMTVTDNRGSWTGRSDRPIAAGSTISLVDSAGTATCHGTVPTAE